MADIKIKCKKCNAELLVSEYADEVVCSKCGYSFHAKEPEDIAKIAAEKKKIIKKRSDDGSEGIPQSLSVDEILRNSVVKKKKNAVQGTFVKMFAVCLVVGVLASICKYTDVLPAFLKDFISLRIPFLFVILHVVIVFSAFKDNVFDGVLSLILPPYAYYYLLFRSDEYIFKAIYIGLLVGYGVEYYDFIMNSYNGFINWGNRMLDGDY